MKKLGKLDVRTARLALAVLLTAAAAVVGVIALLDSGPADGSSAGPEAEAEAVALSLPELLAQASRLGQPVFWVGARAGTESYELSTARDDQVYVRYLSGGAEAGDRPAELLTVGTYPVAAARQALAASAEEGGGALTRHEGYEVLAVEQATSAYAVFDEHPELQVEVFAPQPGEAAELASNGSLRPLR